MEALECHFPCAWAAHPRSLLSALPPSLGSVLLIKETFGGIWEGTITGLARGRETFLRQELGERKESLLRQKVKGKEQTLLALRISRNHSSPLGSFTISKVLPQSLTTLYFEPQQQPLKGPLSPRLPCFPDHPSENNHLSALPALSFFIFFPCCIFIAPSLPGILFYLYYMFTCLLLTNKHG